MSKTHFDDIDLTEAGIEAGEINSESATAGQVLTADGAGRAAFEDAGIVIGGNGGIASGSASSAGDYGIALGSYATAAYQGIALGYGAEASGDHGISIGDGSNATAENGVALGAAAYATASRAVAIGAHVNNPVANSVRIGWGNGAGDYMHMADFTPTAETPTATHTIPVTLNGATYRILLSST